MRTADVMLECFRRWKAQYPKIKIPNGIALFNGRTEDVSTPYKHGLLRPSTGAVLPRAPQWFKTTEKGANYLLKMEEQGFTVKNGIVLLPQKQSERVS